MSATTFSVILSNFTQNDPPPHQGKNVRLRTPKRNFRKCKRLPKRNKLSDRKDQEWTKIVPKGRITDAPKSKSSRNSPYLIEAKNTDSTGGNKSTNKKAFLYVSWYMTGTQPNEIIEMLKGDFPEVICEEVVSKFPQHYWPFKRTIYL